MIQQSLFTSKLDLAFAQYHAHNPQIYQLFKQFAFKVKNAGFKKYSARTIFHRIRWHIEVDTKGDPFKINNNFSSRYARMLIDEFPEFEGFFELRRLKS